MSASTALNRLYPHQLMLPKEGVESVANLFKSLNIEGPRAEDESQKIISINREGNGTSKGK